MSFDKSARFVLSRIVFVASKRQSAAKPPTVQIFYTATPKNLLIFSLHSFESK